MITPVELKQIAVANTLRACPLLNGLPQADINYIADWTVLKTLPKGGYLFREHDPSYGFYIVQSGAINVHRVNAVGKEQVIHVFRAGESLAEGTLASDEVYPADARALEPSKVLLVQKNAFLTVLRRQPELALRLLGAMNTHVHALIGQLEDLTLKDVETRLAHWLVQHCPDPESAKPAKIELGRTKRVLAAELGTVSETLSRTFAKFRAQDLLYVNGKSVTLLNPARMTWALRQHLGMECVQAG